MLNKSSIATSGDPIMVHGSGFQPGEPVVLQLRVDQNLSIIAGGARGAQVTANEAGAFSASFDEVGGASASQARAPGDRSFVASGAWGSRASTPVKVVSSAEPMTAVDTVLLAQGTASGEPVMIWGGGFMPGEVVSLILVGAADGGGDRIVGNAEANMSGAFAGEVSASATGMEGVYTLKATGNMGSVASAVLVVAEPK